MPRWRCGAALAEFADREFARTTAAALEEERRTAVEGLADVLLTAGSFLGTAAVAWAVLGDVERARELSGRSVQAARERGWDGVVAMTLTWAATTAAFGADWARGQALLRELLVLLRRLGTHQCVGDALELTTLALEGTGRPDLARVTLRAADAPLLAALAALDG